MPLSDVKRVKNPVM